jgi:NAD(P)-dependent dehydrogenase (short-subunit alcohol dehydrogenase family)
MKLLEGKTALVTGAGRGIGRGIAIALAKAGANIVVNDFGVALDGQNEADTPAGNVVAEIEAMGGHAVINRGSVAEFTDAADMVKQAVETFGGLDILVHVAGILRDRMIFNMSEEEWDAVIAVHLKGAFNLVQAASRHFRESKRGGRIISMSSDSAYGAAGQPNYAAAKAGILGLTWSCAAGLSRYGVTTNAIMPSGATRMIDATPNGRKMFEETGKWPSEHAKGTAKDPDNVAPLVVYLASDRAANVNGQVFFSQGYSYARIRQPEIERVVTNTQRWNEEELVDMFPRTLGVDLQPVFASEMLQVIDSIPPEERRYETERISSWSAARGGPR